MKLKSTLLLGAFVAGVLGLSSYTNDASNEILLEQNSEKNTISKEEQNKIVAFKEAYFDKYNKTFIPNTDDNNFKPSDLIFHTWAWQKYLHLTQNIKNEKGIKTANGLPLFLDSKDIYQISPDGEKIENDTFPLTLIDFHQAGREHPVLTSNKNFANTNVEHTVFYSIHMNKIMYDQMVSIMKSKEGLFKDTLLTSINNSKNTIDTIDISNSKEKYKNGSLELKAAWIDVKAIKPEDRSKYIVIHNVKKIKDSEAKTIDAKLRLKEKTLDSLKKVNPLNDSIVNEINNLMDDPVYRPHDSMYETVSVALIGLHIVGMVEGFPELLWATFEGQDLAPDNLNNLTDSNSKKRYGFKTNKEINEPITKTNMEFLFYKKGNCEIKGSDTAIEFNPITSKGKIKDKIFRRYPLSISIDNLLNEDFYTHAILENALNTAALTNNEIKMYYNGNIWLGTLNNKDTRVQDVFNQFKQKNLKLAGSPNATNITMETFKQSTQCFTCHTTSNTFSGKYKLVDGKLVPEVVISYNSILNVSHIYTAYFKNKAAATRYPKATQAELNALSEYNKTREEQQLEASFK